MSGLNQDLCGDERYGRRHRELSCLRRRTVHRADRVRGFSVTELVDLTSVCWPRPGTACGLLLASSFPPLWRYALSGWIEVGDDDLGRRRRMTTTRNRVSASSCLSRAARPGFQCRGGFLTGVERLTLVSASANFLVKGPASCCRLR